MDADRCVGSCGWTFCEHGVVECYGCVKAEHRRQRIAGQVMEAPVGALTLRVEVRAHGHCPQNLAAHRAARNAGMTYRGTARNENATLMAVIFVLGRNQTRQPRSGRSATDGNQGPAHQPRPVKSTDEQKQRPETAWPDPSVAAGEAVPFSRSTPCSARLRFPARWREAAHCVPGTAAARRAGSDCGSPAAGHRRAD